MAGLDGHIEIARVPCGAQDGNYCVDLTPRKTQYLLSEFRLLNSIPGKRKFH